MRNIVVGLVCLIATSLIGPSWARADNCAGTTVPISTYARDGWDEALSKGVKAVTSTLRFREAFLVDERRLNEILLHTLNNKAGGTLSLDVRTTTDSVFVDFKLCESDGCQTRMISFPAEHARCIVNYTALFVLYFGATDSFSANPPGRYTIETTMEDPASTSWFEDFLGVSPVR